MRGVLVARLNAIAWLMGVIGGGMEDCREIKMSDIE